MTNLKWIKPARSGPISDNCLELAEDGDMIAVRDSRNPDVQPLRITPDDLRAFVESAKDGQYDELYA